MIGNTQEGMAWSSIIGVSIGVIIGAVSSLVARWLWERYRKPKFYCVKLENERNEYSVGPESSDHSATVCIHNKNNYKVALRKFIARLPDGRKKPLKYCMAEDDETWVDSTMKIDIHDIYETTFKFEDHETQNYPDFFDIYYTDYKGKERKALRLLKPRGF